MVALFYLLPILTCLYLYETMGTILEPWVYPVCVVSSWALTALIHWLMYKVRVSDDEYLGSFISSVAHEDAWTELIPYVVQVPVGKDSRGNTIYKQETRIREFFHPETWMMQSNIGSRHYISRKFYLSIVNTWQTPSYGYNYTGSHILGGVRYGRSYSFNDILERNREIGMNPMDNPNVCNCFFPMTEEHKYTNKLRNSHSIFKFESISKKKAKELGLFDYPPVKDFSQPCILGREFPQEVYDAFLLLNSWYGAHYQIHVYVICFDAAKGVKIAEQQRAYWEGGNKNEFVVCLGLDGDVVKWSHAFSWMDEPTLAVKTEDYFRDHEQLDMIAFCYWLRENLSSWKRKSFKDFNYLSVSLTPTQNYILLGLVIAINIGIAYLVYYFTQSSIPPTPYSNI